METNGYTEEAARLRFCPVCPFAGGRRRLVVSGGGHSGLPLGYYAAVVERSALKGSALQHPIGLVKIAEEVFLLLLGQKTRLCSFDVLQEPQKYAQVQFGK